MTDGLEVLVHDVIAAMTTAPFAIGNALSSKTIGALFAGLEFFIPAAVPPPSFSKRAMSPFLDAARS